MESLSLVRSTLAVYLVWLILLLHEDSTSHAEATLLLDFESVHSVHVCVQLDLPLDLLLALKTILFIIDSNYF